MRDPGAMVWGHPRGADPALTLATGLEDDEVEPGTHVLFDCHGTIDLYCWDGGKTWVVEGEPEGAAKRFADATARVAEMLIAAMRPGARISELQRQGRDIYRREGVPDPDAAVIVDEPEAVAAAEAAPLKRSRAKKASPEVEQSGEPVAAAPRYDRMGTGVTWPRPLAKPVATYAKCRTL